MPRLELSSRSASQAGSSRPRFGYQPRAAHQAGICRDGAGSLHHGLWPKGQSFPCRYRGSRRSFVYFPFCPSLPPPVKQQTLFIFGPRAEHEAADSPDYDECRVDHAITSIARTAWLSENGPLPLRTKRRSLPTVSTASNPFCMRRSYLRAFALVKCHLPFDDLRPPTARARRSDRGESSHDRNSSWQNGDGMQKVMLLTS